MERIRLSVKEIHTAQELAERTLKFSLVRLVIVVEQQLRLDRVHLPLLERHISIHNLAHTVPDRVNVIVAEFQRCTPPVLAKLHLADIAIKAARKGMVNDKDLVRKEFTHSVLQHETQRTEICTPSVRMVISDELHLMGHRKLEIKFLKLVVHQSSQNRVLHAGLGILHGSAHLIGKVPEPLEERHLIMPPVIDKEDIESISFSHIIIFSNP